MTDYSKPQPCGCSLDGRCEVHASMMRFISERGYHGGASAFQRVGRFADGFGQPGLHIGDWSAWRDSSIPAIEAMYREARAF